ncbi:MAG: transcriptional activator NhaR [Myxococcaceae bacterium]|jgi:LysR family transcriptional activator of nhaA|nr:transcriptional activator NhaR [Myxococcaceae bacterium]MCA3012609.1 transcriptional activator NhaR [Myxococcaceae bacterium]
MAWLNYHHLLYFWTVARTGTIANASRELHLSQPTISTQLKTLEDALGQKLFQRAGRRLVLTDVGRTTYRYADEIFRLGRELQESITRGPMSRQVRFTVGVSDVVPKLVAQRLLEPAYGAVPDLQLEVHEGNLNGLLARLALHELDVVLSDSPAPNDVKVRAFSHKLGESGLSFFAKGSQVAPLKKGFPQSLDQAPMLLPQTGSSSRIALDQWFEKKGVRPRVVGEFDDSALMKVFGAAGRGVFTAPTTIEPDVVRQFEVQPIGRTDEMTQAYYAISVERRLRHPAVVAVAESARKEFA